MSFVFTWQAIMELEFSSLFDLLHKQKLFRHNILRLHLLYLCPANSDAFVANLLMKHELMKRPKYKRYPLYMLWIGYMYTTNLVYHFESQLPQSASGTRTFTVPPTVPCGNFSLGAFGKSLNDCVSKLFFTVFLFSIILLLLLPFLWMRDLLQLFLTWLQEILALSHYWSHSGFLHEFLRQDLQ